MKKDDRRVALIICVAAGIMATIGTMFLFSTIFNYMVLRDNYSFAMETAGKIGWTNDLTVDANNAKTALQSYAQSNLFAGILYSLNGTFLKKMLQMIIILVTITFGFASFAFDAMVIRSILVLIKRRIKKALKNSSKKGVRNFRNA